LDACLFKAVSMIWGFHPRSVIPAEAGIHCFVEVLKGPGFPFTREWQKKSL
jgi:hypothetical protein